jgi:kumamolisin
MQGQSLLVASGDAGAYGCSRAGITPPADQALQTGDPNNQPYITSVGGTSFRAQKGGAVLFDPGTNPNPSYPGTSKEVVWNGGCTTAQTDCGERGATGGGVSRIWAEPDYATDPKTGASLPGVSEAAYSQTGSYCNQQPGVLCRQNPDVSLNSDPNTGYAVYCTDADGGCTAGKGWLQFGGTSCAAPIYSGFIALYNQYHKGRSGLFNYIVYPFDSKAGYASQLHDITVGDNGFYPAGPGYDMSTGVGTPDVYNLITAK